MIVVLFSFGLLMSNYSFASCSSNRVSLQVLGSGGPELGDKRASSSYLIWLDGKARVLIDTGSGSSFNFERANAKVADLHAILFTHLHVDHSIDFPAYIKASFFTNRKNDLLVYGPAGNKLMPSTTDFVSRLLGETGAFSYLNDYLDQSISNDYHIKARNIELDKDNIKVIKIGNDITLKTIAVHHGPIAAVAWRVEVLGCSISFSGDMSNRYQVLTGLVKGSDILVAHNAIRETTKGIARNLHMPPSEIGNIAKQANVRMLVLSHRMLRTIGKEQETLKQIGKYYSKKIRFANDLDVFPLKISK